jgi:hypothetical protein
MLSYVSSTVKGDGFICFQYVSFRSLLKKPDGAIEIDAGAVLGTTATDKIVVRRITIPLPLLM